MNHYAHYPEPEDRDPSAAFPDATFQPPRARRARFDALVRDPRRRLLLIAGLAALLLVAIVGLWYGDPTNRARRDLASANERIVDKQREVADARRALAEKIAELRAAQAEADVRATRYRGAIDRATRPAQLDTAVLGGEVVPDVRVDTAIVVPRP